MATEHPHTETGESTQAIPPQAAEAKERAGGKGERKPGRTELGRREPFEPLGRSPFAVVRRLMDEMERFFEDRFFGRRLPWPSAAQGGEATWSPQVDVLRRGDEIVVAADLPGLEQKDVKIEVRDDTLFLEGNRPEPVGEGEEIYRGERCYGRFTRSIALPEGVDPERATAVLANGVLEVHLEVPEEPRRGRSIEITGGTAAEAEKEGQSVH